MTLTRKKHPYKSEHAVFAGRLCLIRPGVTDTQIAEILGVGVLDVHEWRADHPEFRAATSPEPEAIRDFRQKMGRTREIRQRKKRQRRADDPSFRVLEAVRARIWASLKGRSDGKLFQRLGYSVERLMAHLESQFQPGMTWGNYGKWHIDHIKPCAMFNHTNPKEFTECWALENLQPMWALDNMRKGARHASG